jgi:hypothetical protein
MSENEENTTGKTGDTKKEAAGKVKKRQEVFLEALEKTLGIVTQAVNVTGIGSSTHYEWMSDYPDYKKKVEAIQNIAIDFAESKLHKRIEGEDTTAIIFFLKTKGKKRGYGDSQHIDLNVNKLPEVQIGLKVHRRKEEE